MLNCHTLLLDQGPAQPTILRAQLIVALGKHPGSGLDATWTAAVTALFCRTVCGLHRGRGYCRRPDIMGVDEHFTVPPLPRHRYPSSRHTLPDLPPPGRLSLRHPQRGLDRALPPGPSPGACHPAPVTSRRRRPRRASPSPQLRSAKHERWKLCAGVRQGRLGDSPSTAYSGFKAHRPDVSDRASVI